MIRVKDLKNPIDTEGPRPVLLCEQCGETFSAHAGDYCFTDPEHVLTHCGADMVLAVKRTVYQKLG